MKSKLLAILLCSTAVNAATEINQNVVKNFTISNTGLTRISIENDSIKDMFAYPGSVGNSLNLHPSGHLFVAPAGISEPIFLTLISSNGVTQDLKLEFSAKAPKPLVLRLKKERIASKEHIDRWLSVALLGETPRGFRRESPKQNKRVSEKATAREIDRFSNGSYEIAVCQVTSKSPEALTLSAEIFIDPEEGGRLSSNTIPPYGETTLVIINKTKGDRK